MDNANKLRITLDERIGKDNKEKPDFLKVFELFTDDYFIGLSEISHDLYFANLYKDFIGEKEGRTPHLLSVCMHYLDTLPEEDRILFLYHTLVEPFVKIPTMHNGRREKS